eukprot:scaffold277074_cov28-Tisochrysis_lutea.AAC.3
MLQLRPADVEACSAARCHPARHWAICQPISRGRRSASLTAFPLFASPAHPRPSYLLAPRSPVRRALPASG